eukprot:RCo007847
MASTPSRTTASPSRPSTAAATAPGAASPSRPATAPADNGRVEVTFNVFWIRPVAEETVWITGDTSALERGLRLREPRSPEASSAHTLTVTLPANTRVCWRAGIQSAERGATPVWAQKARLLHTGPGGGSLSTEYILFGPSPSDTIHDFHLTGRQPFNLRPIPTTAERGTGGSGTGGLRVPRVGFSHLFDPRLLRATPSDRSSAGAPPLQSRVRSASSTVSTADSTPVKSTTSAPAASRSLSPTSALSVAALPTSPDKAATSPSLTNARPASSVAPATTATTSPSQKTSAVVTSYSYSSTLTSSTVGTLTPPKVTSSSPPSSSPNTASSREGASSLNSRVYTQSGGTGGPG